MFLGIYDYTVYLTYLNLLSGFMGVSLVVFTDKINLASVFLLISGICDIFDGIVSRSKKNRSLLEKRYGVQIDSLADLVSFGVLPVAIGYSLLKKVHGDNLINSHPTLTIAFIFFGSLYVLATLIRLAYFNVLTEENKELTSKGFIGVPVTFSSVLFPVLILIHLKLFKLGFLKDIEWLSPLIYLFFLMLFSFLFVYDKIKFKKQKNILYFFLSALFLTLILTLLYLEICLKK